MKARRFLKKINCNKAMSAINHIFKPNVGQKQIIVGG